MQGLEKEGCNVICIIPRAKYLLYYYYSYGFPLQACKLNKIILLGKYYGNFAIPAFTDNYIWSIVEKDQFVVVDPGDANAVKKFSDENNLHFEFNTYYTLAS